jgi:hypothetical protein
MIWKDYSHLKGSHSFLSPSKHYWLNYSSEKLESSYENHKKIVLGTQYHELASDLIRLAVRLPNNTGSFNSFVNDAIGWKMEPEVLLFYSRNCYGTTDAISFNDGVLRIHDLKTGVSPGSIDQLLIYAGLFYLDYKIDQKELKEIILRIYNLKGVTEFFPDPTHVSDVAAKIVRADKIIDQMSKSVF